MWEQVGKDEVVVEVDILHTLYDVTYPYILTKYRFSVELER